MEITDLLILMTTGLVAGFINVVAGGGSLISIPILIFLGLPPAVANASNRIGIISQNVFGIWGFKSKGISTFPYSLYIGISACLGSIIGALFSVRLDDDVFNRIIAIVMVLVMFTIIFGRKKTVTTEEEKTDRKSVIWGIITFFFIGIYGGFIQAGVGFLIMGALTSINRFSLVKTNSAKVWVVFLYTIVSLVVFIWEDVIDWKYGLILAAGNAAGGWIASRWSVQKGDVWIKRILVVMVLILAVKLWFF